MCSWGKRQRNVTINSSFCSQNKWRSAANSLHHAFPGMLIILSEWKNKDTKRRKLKRSVLLRTREDGWQGGEKGKVNIPHILQQGVKSEDSPCITPTVHWPLNTSNVFVLYQLQHTSTNLLHYWAVLDLVLINQTP